MLSNLCLFLEISPKKVGIKVSRNVCVTIEYSITDNRDDGEMSHMSINSWSDKRNKDPHNGMFLFFILHTVQAPKYHAEPHWCVQAIHIKQKQYRKVLKGKSALCNTVDEHWGNCTKGNKLITETNSYW